MKTKKKSGKTLPKSGKSQGKIREFDGIKKVGTLPKFFSYGMYTRYNCTENFEIGIEISYVSLEQVMVTLTKTNTKTSGFMLVVTLH